MRRIILAAAAALFLHAAPAMADECTNLALESTAGVASASSQYNATYAARLLNNGYRDYGGWGYWNDATRNAYPDWAQIEWFAPRTIDRIVVRAILSNDSNAANRTLRRARVQYWDATASSWTDVVAAGNPIVDWVTAWYRFDGNEIRSFDLATPITTSKIRVLIEDGYADGYSYLDEIEAYRSGIGCPARPQECTADVALDGTASASSTHGSGLYPVTGVNNGRRESGDSMGYWNDNTNGTWPDWVQVAWDRPQTLSRIVARIPLAREEFPLGEITLRRTRIQYWDDAASAWVDVVGRTGQDNPIIDWSGPREVYDGSESRAFNLATPITTTKIRALIEDGSTDGWSWMDELEAYAAGCGGEPIPTPRDVNLAQSFDGATASVSSRTVGGGMPYILINGRRDTFSYGWVDGTRYTFPDWAQVAWQQPLSINRIVARMPTTSPALAIARARIQYWDDATGVWIDVVGRAGQDNPVVNWSVPVTLDGSEIKQFDFPTVSTSKIRVYFEEGTSTGFSTLDELEAYWVS